MTERREIQTQKSRLPAMLVLLVAMAAMMASGDPRSVAVNSPVETEPVLISAQSTAEVTPLHSIDVVAEEPEEPEESLVEESAPVEDTYFEDAVFLGDSRTEGFALYSGLEEGTYFCAVGATVESVFSKAVETEVGRLPLLDAMAETACGKIYVMLGVNELGWAKTETFRTQYAKLIDRLRTDHPEAEVIIQSILPVSAKQEEKGSYVNNTRIAEYNEILQELANEKGCPFLNVAEAVSEEDGTLRADWNFDGVHLNPKGCRVWLEYLKTHSV